MKQLSLDFTAVAGNARLGRDARADAPLGDGAWAFWPGHGCREPLARSR